MSAPAALKVESQSLDFDDLEEIFASGTLPIFKSSKVRRQSRRIGARQNGFADCPWLDTPAVRVQWLDEAAPCPDPAWLRKKGRRYHPIRCTGTSAAAKANAWATTTRNPCSGA